MTPLHTLLAVLALAAGALAASPIAGDRPAHASSSDTSAAAARGTAHHAVKRGRGKDDGAGHTRQGNGRDDRAGDDRGGKKSKKKGKGKKDDRGRKGAHHGPNHT